MPKLAQEKMDERISLVEEAALRLFRRKGFHGVGLRDIAEEAGVSLGNIYNYFSTKEEIYEALLDRLYAGFTSPEEPLVRFLAKSTFPDDLEAFGKAVGEMVERHSDYLTLVYVDIAEFQGRTVRKHYANLPERFSKVLGKRFSQIGKVAGGVDPAVAFTALYMQFFNYFVVERLIGAKGHLGLPDEKAIRAIALVFQNGLGRETK